MRRIVLVRKFVFPLLALVCAVTLLSRSTAEPPGKPGEGPDKDRPKATANAALVDRMMAFNKKKDGKLTKDEVTDVRLHRLFDQADTNKDGVVTKEELIALAAKLEAEARPDDGPGRRGPDGPGRGPDGPGRGPDGPGRGPGGPGGPGGPPRPGQILPPHLQDRLNLTADQKMQLEALQKDVDDKLAKILTDEQKKQLKEMRGPGRPGGPGDRGPGDRGPGDRGPGERGPRGGDERGPGGPPERREP
jgi:EF hand